MAKLITKNISKTTKFLEYSGKTLCRGLRSSVPVKEIKIPVPWGHIAAKLWGSQQRRPILALHGWQDNCGSWDPLAPLICDKIPILAIDWVGHGQSSWLPPGATYNETWELIPHIHLIKEYFKWDKISMLGHSLGSVAGLRYAGLYPEDVDMCIAIENLVYDEVDVDMLIKVFPKILQKRAECLNPYNVKEAHGTMEELTDKLYMGMFKSIEKENMHYLMKRGTKPSSEDPNKFDYTRDIRLKNSATMPFRDEFLEKLIARISCPLLYFQGIESIYKLTDPHCLRVQEILKNNNSNFEKHYVHGSHHVHVNNPEVLEPIIVDFLRKHKFIVE